jgi:hypothetical protein
MTTWRCPACGSGSIELDGQQTYEVQKLILCGDVLSADILDPVSDPTFTRVQCMDCGRVDDSDKHWHMTDKQWERELKSRKADFEYDKARDK